MNKLINWTGVNCVPTLQTNNASFGNCSHNNINNFIMAGAPAPGEEEPTQQQFSQLSGLSYVKSGKQVNNPRGSFKGEGDTNISNSAP